MLSFRGSWQLTVIGADACWPQRVVVNSDTVMVIPGRVGEVATVAGDLWWLTVEHDPGDGWRPNVRTLSGGVHVRAGRMTRLVRSKDGDRPGGRRPNDLKLALVFTGSVFRASWPFAGTGGALPPMEFEPRRLGAGLAGVLDRATATGTAAGPRFGLTRRLRRD